MGIISPDPPPPQDSPPPKYWGAKSWKSKRIVTTPPFFKKYMRREHSIKEMVTQPHLGVRQLTKNHCLSTLSQQLLSSSEVKTTVGVLVDERERVLLVEVPLNHQQPSEFYTLISLATLWVSILLRKVVKHEDLSWYYVLRILNSEATSITFDELFGMSIQSSREDLAAQVFISVLQNESLHDELFNFLKAFAQMCIVKIGVLPLQDLQLTISSDIMETSGLKAEFEHLMKDEYERVLTVRTISDGLDEPPHLTVHLTVLVDAVHISEKLGYDVNQSLENCRDQHTPHAAARGKSAVMEELQMGECPTSVTSSTSGTALKGSKDLCTRTVEWTDKKTQILNENPGIEDKTFNATYDQSHGNVMKFQPSTKAQCKPVEKIYLKPIEPESEGDCKLTDIQDDSSNSSTIETESATSSYMYSDVSHNLEQPCSVRKETSYPCEEPSTSHNKSSHPSSSLPPSSLQILCCNFHPNFVVISMLDMPHQLYGTSCVYWCDRNPPFVVVLVGSHSHSFGQLINRTRPSTAMYEQFTLPFPALNEEDNENLSWHIGETPPTQIPEAGSWDDGMERITICICTRKKSMVNVRIRLSDQIMDHHLKARKGVIGKLVMEEMLKLSKRITQAEVDILLDADLLVDKEKESVNDLILSSPPTPWPSQPQSWKKHILKDCSNLASLKSFIQSLPPGVLTLKDAAEGKTLYHILAGWCDEAFTSSDVIHLLELFGEHFLQQCRACQDFSGNTPLHCSVDVRSPNTGIVQFLLKFTSRESLLIVNNDNLTPLELSFEKSYWLITQMLIEHHIETGASNAAELLQQYIFKAVKKHGGSCFLSQLLDMRDHYCPDLNLNFGNNESSRTPWWYLVHSTTDVSVMHRILQALKNHSIEFKSLLTHTKGDTNLVVETIEKNKVLFNIICRVAGWQHNEEDQIVPNEEGFNISGSSEEVVEKVNKTTKKYHFTHDEETSNISELEALPPSFSSVPSKLANDQSSHPQLEQVRLLLWLSQCDESVTEGRDCQIPSEHSSIEQHGFPRSMASSGIETGGQRLLNKGKPIFRSRQPKPTIFRHISSSESEVDHIGGRKSSNPAQRSFLAVAGDEERELPPDTLPWDTNTIHVQEQSFESTTKLPPPEAPFDIHMKFQPPQTGSVATEDMSQSSSGSFSESGMTSLEADDSSDGVSDGTLPKAKCFTSQLHRKHVKKVIPAVHSVPHVTTKGKKSSLVVLHQRSGYSGDDSDHKNEYIGARVRSSRFTRAQRAAGKMKKEWIYSTSSSEYSDEEIEEQSAQIGSTKYLEYALDGGTYCIKLTIHFTICKLELLNSADCMSTSASTPDLRRYTELHHAVRQQCLKSVQCILSCDGGEDQIQTMDDNGCTPLEIAAQSGDLKIFEVLLQNLLCSQASPSVTLLPCSGHLQGTLMTSIVKVLSKLEIEICPSTLHWMMVGCQHWKLPKVLYATPTTVPTTTLLQVELFCSQAQQNQILTDERIGNKEKKNIKRSEEQATQEQETPSQSELVSVTCRFETHVYRSAGMNSLVTGITLTRCGRFESHQRQTRTSTGIPPHEPNCPSDTSAARKTPSSTNSNFSPGGTGSTLPLVAADSPSYSQHKSSATKQSTSKQVSQSTGASLRSKGKDSDEDASPRLLGIYSDEEVTAWQAWVEKAVDCLHAGYYSQMLEVLKFGKVLPSLPPEIAMAVQFGYALAYYKLDKHSEAAKHLESLKTIAASAQSCGNESIASVYLGDIEFTQSRYTEAAKHYSHALELYKGDDNVGKEYRLVVPTFSAISAKLGSAFRNASKIVDAVQAYRQAIATADSKKDRLSAHTSLGNLFQSVGENASALAEYEHSIRLSDELRDYISLGWAYGNMGNAYLGLYQRDKGLNYLMKALNLTVEHEPTPQAISRAFNNLGTAYQALNELDKAEENYDLALSQSIYGNDLPGQARVYGNIGNVLMLRKDHERAIPHYTEVLHLSRDRSTVSTAFHNRGCSYYEWAESRKAILFQKDDSSVKKDQFFLSGPDFKDCEVEHQPPVLPNSILKYYQQGRQDLEEVVKYHEETFDNIKGSSKGLTLSVSLFETNSRTFHRLQDCLVNLGELEKALVVAEQSRTRTLGELLVKRKGWQIDHPLTAPLNLDSISDIVKSQQSIVVYLSYTGARLLGWVLAPKSSKVSVNMFEVPLEDDQFEGKSFDYHLRYSLTEVLVERNFEMYRAVDYQSELNEPVRKLYRLVGRPLMKIFKELRDPDSTPGVQDIVIIPDSYTNLIPFPCLLAGEDGVDFLGDNFSFRIMPSLLTMGIVDQLPSVVVQVPADSQNMCVVGNPTVPTFVYNDEKWSLGKLPFATREAEWVANTLKTTPILHEQATKNAVLMRIMKAKVIHMATHGSASAGFLALAGMSSRNEAAEAKSILLYPEDVERLNISPVLVVLSSCDSGRGMVKADGILGMARAFILAGAQTVLTTLWRVPDESASIFMQFFYQYLMDGLKGSLALQKATLSLRCFSKYSQYIHWSGYQLTGREIQFDNTKPSTAAALESRLGKSSVFPRLEVVKQLESTFLRDPQTPSDVQILRGSPGVKPSEPLIDFIHSFHHAFKGGIFWINGRRQELIDASAAFIKQETGTVPTASQTHPILIVFDYIDQMPQFSNPTTSIMTLLRNPNTHIVIISKNYAPPDALLKEVDQQLMRGCRVIDVEPLSMIHTTQRMVHSVLSAHHLAPTNEDQNFFEKVAEFTFGSPVLTDVATALLLSEIKRGSQDKPQDIHEMLVNFKNQLSLEEMGPSTKPVTVVRHEPPKGMTLVREMSKNVYDHIDSIKETEQDPWCTSSTYDSWQAVAMLVDQCSLTAEEKLLLFAVSMFSCSPIPMKMVTEVSSMIAKASQKLHISTSLHSKLFQMHLMKRYPLPVILHPSLDTQKQSTQLEFIYMPQYIARAIWKDMMSPRDKVMALSTSFMALRTLADNTSSSDIGFLRGLSSLLLEVYELNYELMGKKCYQEVYKLYLCFHVREKQKSFGAHRVKMSDESKDHVSLSWACGGIGTGYPVLYQWNKGLMEHQPNPQTMIQLQAVIRGYLARRQFKQAKHTMIQFNSSRIQDDRETYYASLWTPAAPNPQVTYYAIFSIVHQSDLQKEFQSVTKELAVLEPGITFQRASHLISLWMEAIELKIPDENVCKQQYGCRITVDAGPPRFTRQELKSAPNIPKKLLRIIPQTYLSDEKAPAKYPLELFLHGTVERRCFTVWVPCMMIHADETRHKAI